MFYTSVYVGDIYKRAEAPPVSALWTVQMVRLLMIAEDLERSPLAIIEPTSPRKPFRGLNLVRPRFSDHLSNNAVVLRYQIEDEATRLGSRALFYNALVSFAGTLLLPFCILESRDIGKGKLVRLSIWQFSSTFTDRLSSRRRRRSWPKLDQRGCFSVRILFCTYTPCSAVDAQATEIGLRVDGASRRWLRCGRGVTCCSRFAWPLPGASYPGSLRR